MSKSVKNLRKINVFGPSAFLEALLGASGAVLGQLRANFGHLGGFLARLTPSGAVWGAFLGQRGTLLGRFGAVLEAILGVLVAILGGLEASWAVLGPS